ncbi:hypothetical protein D3C77_723540 [compost metagenome]
MVGIVEADTDDLAGPGQGRKQADGRPLDLPGAAQYPVSRLQCRLAVAEQLLQRTGVARFIRRHAVQHATKVDCQA